jgi:hypothetical protein
VVEAPACVESLPKRAADDVAKPKEAEMRDWGSSELSRPCGFSSHLLAMGLWHWKTTVSSPKQDNPWLWGLLSAMLHVHWLHFPHAFIQLIRFLLLGCNYMQACLQITQHCLVGTLSIFQP